ncbi:uncharacterized protein [Linepithema humile]|uniref:uncharacterized protein isoform X2 n=1 Tax=Linepithema humile TaxID=83485 RepID=UPI0006239EF5|nr:PREDICTED: uncharacterized protein LOC105676139 isoform X2 [Linepithema humile]
MSVLLNQTEFAYLNNNETEEDLFLSEDENEDFNFKYVPANRFKYIVKDVRRQRCREEEETVWASFVKQQELNVYDKNDIQPSVQSVKQLLDEGLKEADEELKRLETGILSGRIRKESSRTENNQKKKTKKVNNTRDLFPKKVPIMKDTGTGSTNLLLTIPEEENIHERKQESEKLKSHARKSRSATVQKKQSSKLPHHMANGVEYNSSPESSARRNDTDGTIYIRPDPFTMHKILTMQTRVCELLDEIAFRLGNIPPPDGIKDLQRRQQCVAEFVVRFSRNYLYDLNRYVKDIQRHMCIISPRAIVKPNHRSFGLHMHAIEHKLLAAHQLLLHALIAYCKHIPGSILKGHPGKFREILQVVIDLKTMCDRLHLNYLNSGDTDILSLGKDIENKSNAILSKLKLYAENDLRDIKTSSTSVSLHSTNNKKRYNRKQLSNRLSMYSVDSKVPKSNPKHRTNYYQKDKRYNTINTNQGRTSNEPILDHPYPSPVTLTPSKDTNYTGTDKHKTYAKDEDIRTMMDMLPIDSDNGSNFETQERHNNTMLTRRIPKATRKCSGKQDQRQIETIENIVRNTSTNNDDELAKRATTITEEHLSNLVPVIADLMSFVSTKKHQSPKSANTKISASTSCDVCHSISSSCECEHPKTSRTLTGNNGENMRLICLSSMEDAPKVPRYCDASCQADYERLMAVPDFEMKAKEGKRIVDSLDNIELVVSEESEINFLKYRREYEQLMQSIPMYSSNTQNKPWDIVAWISDKLVDELITEIAKELQIEDVIQKLFELEFQEF